MSETAVAFDNRVTDQQIKLTPPALEQMRRLLDQVDDDAVEAVRVFVSGGGCGGMTYGMTFTDRRSPYDCVLEDDQGFRLYVDSVAINYLQGVEIDFVDRPMGASFVFNNVFQATGGSGSCKACGSTGGGCG
ncbi:MAG: iron-sulfur cluster assembly accessory protein [Gammaproteobacteria bacterium]|nr:iron-sulfur cluster assembly accessory protein [Gammaproteobacteria bacterium]